MNLWESAKLGFSEGSTLGFREAFRRAVSDGLKQTLPAALAENQEQYCLTGDPKFAQAVVENVRKAFFDAQDADLKNLGSAALNNLGGEIRRRAGLENLPPENYARSQGLTEIADLIHNNDYGMRDGTPPPRYTNSIMPLISLIQALGEQKEMLQKSPVTATPSPVLPVDVVPAAIAPATLPAPEKAPPVLTFDEAVAAYRERERQKNAASIDLARTLSVVDKILENAGPFPSDDLVRRYGEKTGSAPPEVKASVPPAPPRQK